MKVGVGKISSVVATFEGNIAKNYEVQAAEGTSTNSKSFLTTIAVNPNASSTIQKLKLKSSLKLSSDLHSSQHSTKDCKNSPGISETYNIKQYRKQEIHDTEHDVSCITDSTADEESTANSTHERQQPMANLEPTKVHKNDKDRIVRKVAIVRSKIKTNRNLPDSKADKIQLDSSTKATIRDFIRNAESQRRPTSSNSDRAIVVTSAISEQQATESSECSATEYKINHNPTRLNPSITTIRHPDPSQLQKIAATIRRVSSSNSLRELASAVAKQTKTSPTISLHKNSPKPSDASKSDGDSSKKSRKKLSDHMNQSLTSNDKKTRAEKSIVSLPIKSVTTTPTRQPSFLSLPEILQSTITSNAEVTIDDNNEDVELTKTSVIEVTKFVKEVLNSREPELQEVDMEYGPQDMDTKFEPKSFLRGDGLLLPSTDFSDIMSTCESEATKSICGTEATPVGIAKAARRSSVELISSIHSTYANRIPGIAKAARRSSVELTNSTSFEDTNSVSGITTISENSSLDIPDIASEASSNDGPPKAKHIRKTISNLSLISLERRDEQTQAKPPDVFKIDENASDSHSIRNTDIDYFYLPPRHEVVGVLRKKGDVRNVTRHVQFADQQPGGGQRMSLDRSVKNDSLPVQPRRSNRNLDRLKTLRQKHNLKEASAKPLKVISMLAATTIQAAARRWIQWKKVRPQLLLQKLLWIEEQRKLDLAKIQQQKWEIMESIQKEINEEEKRLYAQVSLGEKLCEHLKRDSKFIRHQTKKLKEYCQTMQSNNDHLDKSSRLLRENFMTMNFVVDFLQEKSDTLLSSSRKCASRIDNINHKLQITENKIDFEKSQKIKTMKTVKRIIRHLEHKGVDIFPFINGQQSTPINLQDIGPNGFELAVSNDEDDMSMFSDITTESARARAAIYDGLCADESFDKSQKSFHASNYDDLNRTDSSRQLSTAISCENSFASYKPRSSHNHISAKGTNDVNSVNGDSFASYGTYGVHDTTRIANDPNEVRKIGASNSFNANPPSRRISGPSGFEAIHEEISLNEDSTTLSAN